MGLFSSNLLKVGLATAGANLAGEYLFGQATPSSIYSLPSRFAGDNLSASFLNTLGVTPFQSTSVGTALRGYSQQFSEYIPDFLKTNSETVAEVGKAGVSMAAQFFQGDPSAPGGMPDKGGIRPTAVRTDNRFSAGKVNPLPLGRNGLAQEAYESPLVQQILAKAQSSVQIPRTRVQNPTISMTSGSVSVSSPSISTRSVTKRTKYSTSGDKD